MDWFVCSGFLMWTQGKLKSILSQLNPQEFFVSIAVKMKGIIGYQVDMNSTCIYAVER
jgi:hypothetical protein